MVRQAPSKEERFRAQVLEAAQQLFQQYGLQKVTMEDVARASGKSKSTLYYYYKSKEEIFDAVVDHEIRDVQGQLRMALEQADTAGAKLESFVLTKLRVLRKKAALYNLLHQDITRQYIIEFTERTRQNYQQAEVDMVKQILQLGVDNKEFTALANQDLDQVAVVLTSSVLGIEQHALLNEKYEKAEASIRLLSSILVRGLQL